MKRTVVARIRITLALKCKRISSPLVSECVGVALFAACPARCSSMRTPTGRTRPERSESWSGRADVTTSRLSSDCAGWPLSRHFVATPRRCQSGAASRTTRRHRAGRGGGDVWLCRERRAPRRSASAGRMPRLHQGERVSHEVGRRLCGAVIGQPMSGWTKEKMRATCVPVPRLETLGYGFWPAMGRTTRK